MKPRVITTQKLLVGLFVATAAAVPSAGSAAAATAPAAMERIRPPSDKDGYPLVGNLIRKAGGAQQRPAPPPDGEVSPALLALRDELEKQTEAEAAKQMARFRPLCDKAGYPLVGNMIRKEPAGYQPSAFCAAVRKAKGRP